MEVRHREELATDLDSGCTETDRPLQVFNRRGPAFVPLMQPSLICGLRKRRGTSADMIKRDIAGHKSLADAVRELIGTEDNRRHVQKLFGPVATELSPTLASLVEAIGKARDDEAL